MWVLEGYAAESGNRRDVWYSADGVEWTELPDTPWAPRHAASVFAYDGSLWMVAGNNMEPGCLEAFAQEMQSRANSGFQQPDEARSGRGRQTGMKDGI